MVKQCHMWNGEPVVQPSIRLESPNSNIKRSKMVVPGIQDTGMARILTVKKVGIDEQFLVALWRE